MKKISVGIYGDKGHQIHHSIQGELKELVTLSAFCLCEAPPEWLDAARYNTLDDMLADDNIELISLCSPTRREQARQAIRCMEAGKHVYAEKPCAMTEEDLDEILAVSKKTGKVFCEMAGTAFEEPYLTMRRLISEGEIGEVVQVLAQKSYPLSIRSRPQDEDIDGGLICQNGIHALRFVEHVAGQRIKRISAVETNLGNTLPGGLKTAASFAMELENGGVASVVANYMNPKKGFGQHGNESLRVFGTKGFIEATDGGQRTRLVLSDTDMGPFVTESTPVKTYFQMMIEHILGLSEMPYTPEAELHPTRMVIRAKESAKKGGIWSE